MPTDPPTHIRVTIAAIVLVAVLCGFILLRENGGGSFAWCYFLVCALVTASATFLCWRKPIVRTVGVLTGLATFTFFLVTLFAPSAS